MVLSNRINFIRKIAFFLFLFSFLSLIASLWLNNTLATFKFKKDINDKILKPVSGYIFKSEIACSQDLNSCKKDFLDKLEYSEKLGDCFENEFKTYYIIENKIYDNDSLLYHSQFFQDNNYNNNLKSKFIGKNIVLNVEVLNNKNNTCIKNSPHNKLYKIIPFFYEFIFNLKNNPKTSLGSSVSINPFIHGEASISNIVKRFPVNFVFKPLLFVSVILMYLYWVNYNFLFRDILKSKKNIFLFFGIGSSILLFFHVLFLGIEIDSKLFKNLRRLIIVLFILFEVIAQFILTIKLYRNKKKLNDYCNILFIKLKLFFVSFVTFVSVLIIIILVTTNFSNKIDYILEWNYFAGLLFYYFLSFLMWKKIN